MDLIWAFTAIAVGVVLAVYSVETITDSFWSRGTKVMGVLGAVMGVLCIFTGFAGLYA